MKISKVQQAKDAQGYQKNPLQCSNCGMFVVDRIEMPATKWSDAYIIEKNKRCGLGKFAVQSTGWCKVHFKK
jgi:hypothetical protein